VEIGAYRDDDWPRVWPIVREVIIAGETYAYDPAWSEETVRGIWVEAGTLMPAHTVVAVDGDDVLGTAKTGPNRAGPGAHVATASFMVAAAARGRGVGRALGEYVLDRARADGFASMQFNAVVETNEAAVRLWQSLGFEIIGTVPEAFEHPRLGRVGLHVMYQRL
jgi:L-amino acid N-acyltransferase YncA